MSGVHTYGIAEAGQGLVQLLCQHILMTQQCVGIGEVWVNLYGPLKELDGHVMLLLQTEAVASGAPALQATGTPSRDSGNEGLDNMGK